MPPPLLLSGSCSAARGVTIWTSVVVNMMPVMVLVRGRRRKEDLCVAYTRRVQQQQQSGAIDTNQPSSSNPPTGVISSQGHQQQPKCLLLCCCCCSCCCYGIINGIIAARLWSVLYLYVDAAAAAWRGSLNKLGWWSLLSTWLKIQQSVTRRRRLVCISSKSP